MAVSSPYVGFWGTSGAPTNPIIHRSPLQKPNCEDIYIYLKNIVLYNRTCTFLCAHRTTIKLKTGVSTDIPGSFIKQAMYLVKTIRHGLKI